jgi:hypothetical protein
VKSKLASPVKGKHQLNHPGIAAFITNTSLEYNQPRFRDMVCGRVLTLAEISVAKDNASIKLITAECGASPGGQTGFLAAVNKD